MSLAVRGTAEAVVCLELHGQKIGDSPRDDGGMIKRFYAWLTVEQIWSAVPGGYSGAGSMRIFLWPDDAERAVAWLKNEGVVFVDT